MAAKLHQKWDRQMEEDLATGKLDALIGKAEADIAANNVRDINKILDKLLFLSSLCSVIS